MYVLEAHVVQLWLFILFLFMKLTAESGAAAYLRPLVLPRRLLPPLHLEPQTRPDRCLSPVARHQLFT